MHLPLHSIYGVQATVKQPDSLSPPVRELTSEMHKDTASLKVPSLISTYIVSGTVWKSSTPSNAKWLEMKEEFMSCGSKNIFSYM